MDSSAYPQSVSGDVEADAVPSQPKKPRNRNRRKAPTEADKDDSKRRCVSTACLECRRRKSKCDGNLPACAACSQVYGTECIYDPNSDHRRKGVYKNDIESLKTRPSTLQTLIHAILNYSEDEVPDLVRDIRTCESLDAVADKVVAREHGLDSDDDEDVKPEVRPKAVSHPSRTFETQLYGKMGDLRLDDGSVRYIGGTSNLIYVAADEDEIDSDEYPQQENAITSWSNVTNDHDLILHLLNMYFTWHYTFFTTLSKPLFYRDFLLGHTPGPTRRKANYCSPLLVNAMLALGCHFTSHQGARENPDDSATAGDHFFREAKRLMMMNDEHEKPRLTTVQALALMSVREAGCGREAKGWVYSGMSFRMASDMGLNLDSGRITSNKNDEAEEDVRRVTFWGCYLFDKCWSNYLGRLPQLPTSMVTAPKFEVFPDEDASQWSPYTDSGFMQAHVQPARTRAVSLQIAKLCEISNDIMKYFYDPADMTKTKGKSAELKKLSDIHTRLETWKRELPAEMEPKEGGLSSILVMHMLFQLLYIHLFRPFLRYTQETSPLPSNVSPRKLCTQAAQTISKLLRLYKRSHGLRQICNIAVYIAHSACTIHILNLPDKNARRDIVHGVKHLEEIAEGWLCARRTLRVLSVLARKWHVELPEEAAAVLARTDAKFGHYLHETRSSPGSSAEHSPEAAVPPVFPPDQQWNGQNGQAPHAQVVPNSNVNMSGAPPVMNMPVTMPASQQQYQPPPVTPANQAKPLRTSPSAMFGGVEQLLRDSNDWVYRDQAQIATGFGNWNHAGAEMDPSNWGGIMRKNSQRQHSSTMASPVRSAHPPAPLPITNMPIPPPISTAQMAFTMSTQTHVPAPVNGQFAMPNWLNGMGAYNEDEWYQ